MKILCLSLLLALGLRPALSQTWDELLRQKKTQLAYLEDQIQGLRQYRALLKGGYQMVGQELDTLRSAAGEETDLHRVYFKSRHSVNPKLARAEVLAHGQRLHRAISGLWANLPTEGLTPPQAAHLRQVREGVLAGASLDMGELLRVAVPGTYLMDDTERLRQLWLRIALLEEKRRHTLRFALAVQALVYQRTMALREISLLRRP
ncbi:hypothetical protein [Rufibacter sp. LB8]|uniref:hypothetical protein n=1 Tax=Rufibacter sp. LB8 TaxID=2777781 RepID=UPI00178C6F52|nr:hypothetical protein [Rufibacter sp. LB8]